MPVTRLRRLFPNRHRLSHSIGRVPERENNQIYRPPRPNHRSSLKCPESIAHYYISENTTAPLISQLNPPSLFLLRKFVLLDNFLTREIRLSCLEQIRNFLSRDVMLNLDGHSPTPAKQIMTDLFQSLRSLIDIFVLQLRYFIDMLDAQYARTVLSCGAT